MTRRERPRAATAADAARLVRDVRVATDDARHAWDAAILAADVALDERDDEGAAEALEEQRRVLQDLETRLQAALGPAASEPTDVDQAPAPATVHGVSSVPVLPPPPGEAQRPSWRPLAAAAAGIAAAVALLTGGAPPALDIAPVPQAADPVGGPQTADAGEVDATVAAAAESARLAWPPSGLPVPRPGLLDRLAAFETPAVAPTPVDADAAGSEPADGQEPGGGEPSVVEPAIPLRLPDLPVVGDLDELSELERQVQEARETLRRADDDAREAADPGGDADDPDDDGTLPHDPVPAQG